ncbi:hypothetical protein [Halobacillus salinus]|uniref:Uncharacterized protein n=1 Tax=Halobacillus salinus TaxID=192814 RepID=A0A4Z0H1C8_9BACI|nr:hypothetical protein [Halobacillus salinus]TGB03789.1 hypothetical protein E4663_01925 [Halobacillus salinus]
MENCLYVSKSFRYEKGKRGCCCHGMVAFEKGDQLHIVGAPVHLDHHGWYVPAQKNEEEPFPMGADFIDELYGTGVLRTSWDLSLALNYHQYKIDQSLEEKQEAAFIHHSHSYQSIESLLTGSVAREL